MTIACNSALVQTETLHYTFARQAVIVYFHAERSILMYWPIMFLPVMSDYTYINSQQTINMAVDIHVAYLVWITIIWHCLQRFGSKLHYIEHRKLVGNLDRRH